MRLLFVLLMFLAAESLPAAEVMLYDASLGTVPSQQAWLGISNNGTPAITYTGAATRLDTSGESNIQSGFFSEDPIFGSAQHPLMPVLDRHVGFSIDFNLQVLSETHPDRDDNNDGLFDRAGFSVITISEDLFGLELGFFEDRVWAYEQTATGLFVQDEYALFDTTGMVNYRLTGTTSGYSLFANDSSILTGAWRQYDESFLFPYDNPSSLFFGDDTSSASSDVLIGDISVINGPVPTAVPIPLPLPALALAIALVGYRVRDTGQ